MIAQYYMAIMYYYGYGVEKNNSLAVSWLNKSANNGYDKAQLFLANFYLNGEGIEKNLKKIEKYKQFFL